jgi:hypothetical protein
LTHPDARLVLLLALGACSERTTEDPPATTPVPAVDRPAAAGDLRDEASARGLDYVNRSGRPEKDTILEANGAGVAVIDLGNDGDSDLVFAQGLASLEALASGPGADLEVFENDGTGHFSRRPGPGLSGWWTALAAADLDADGDQDLVAGGYGGLVVLLQEQDGRLASAHDLCAELGLRALVPGALDAGGGAPSWCSALVPLDADRDGVLDLYVGRYLDLDPLAPPRGELGEGALAIPCSWKGHAVYCGPRGMKPQPDLLLRGLGGGAFRDETSLRLPELEPGYTLAAAAFDAEGDGDGDLFVAADSSPNFLLVNDGSGRFVDRAWEANVALGMDGRAEAGMGVAIGDVDRDGRMDFAVTNFSDEPTELYLGADVGFSNATYRAGLSQATRRLLSWSVHLRDFDGDSWLELFMANGHVYPQADLPGTGTRYGQAATLYRLGSKLRAERVEPASEASILAPELGSRGSAVGDFDGDGAPDVVLVRIDGAAALGMNRMDGVERLVVRCLGPRAGTVPPGDGVSSRSTPQDGIGTRVIVVVARDGAEVGLLEEVHTAEGYGSASAPELFFGLGAAKEVADVIVQWPSGRVDHLGKGASGRRIVVREGEGIVAEERLR